MKNYFTYILFILVFFPSIAQVGINTTTPKAELEVAANNTGVLLSTVNLASVTDATTVTNSNTAGSPAIGTMVYNKGTGGLKDNGLLFWNGNSWIALAKTSVGEVKYSLQQSDHDGWYLLNGRTSASIINTTAKANAGTLFGFNLPNAQNTIAIGKTNTAEVLGSNTGGDYNYLLTQNNLPSFPITPSLSTDGNHDHTGVTEDNNHQHSISDSGANSIDVGYPLGGATNGLDDNNTVPRTIATSSNGVHNHTLTTASAGDHPHSFSVNSINATQTTISLEPSSIVTNVFVFLGK